MKKLKLLIIFSAILLYSCSFNVHRDSLSDNNVPNFYSPENSFSDLPEDEVNTGDTPEISKDYYSLHRESIGVSYTNSNGQVIIENRTGFLYQNDITDPKIECNSELSCPNTSDSAIITLPAINLGSPGNKPPTSKSEKFRVFIPKGTVKLNLVLFCEAMTPLASVIKFYTPPECSQCQTNYYSTPFTNEDSFPFENFLQKEIYLQNAGGHINIYTKSLLPPDLSGENPPWLNEGWLYIDNYVNSYAIGQIQAGLKVHKKTYLNWYKAYKQSVTNDSKNDVWGLLP